MIDQHHEPKPGAAAAEMSELHIPGFKEQLATNLRRNFIIYNRAPEYNITRAAITILVGYPACTARMAGRVLFEGCCCWRALLKGARPARVAGRAPIGGVRLRCRAGEGVGVHAAHTMALLP